MNKSFLGLAVGAALTLSAGTALADGYGYGSLKDGPVVAPQPNWNGLYIGAAVGYGIANTELAGFTESIHEDFKKITSKISIRTHYLESEAGTEAKGVSSDGFQGTLTLGYDRQIHPGILIGIFGDYTFGSLENEIAMGGYLTEGLVVIDYTVLHPTYLKTKIDNNWSIGGRVGLIHEKTLWYAFAGYTQADLDWSYATYFEGEDFGSGSGSERLKGYFLGLGVEQQLFQNVSLKLEYRYTNYDKVTFGREYETEQYEHRSAFRADPDVHSFRLGVNWKVDLFGGHHATPAYDSLK